MKVAVIGLGMEGKKALHSLLDYGHQVYASDIEQNLNIEREIENDKELCGKQDDYEFELDIGKHDWEKIDSADAVVLSPSLWNIEAFKKLTPSNKLLSDVLNRHKSIFTIGVTGTNGKTTTCFMIKEILENSGYKVLIGGNAGGGFEGYTKIMLEANQNDYDILIVEVCDMTLDSCLHDFDFDLLVVTNLGYDHLDVHQSIPHYQKSLQKFLTGKKAVLNVNDEFLSAMGNYPAETFFFDHYPGELKLFGKFNQQNAAAAVEVAKILQIPQNEIDKSLEAFDPVDGRIDELNLENSRIIIGKTDNTSATAAVLEGEKFDLAIIGTPRRNEYWRYDILEEVYKTNPQLVGLFPGLDDTTSQAKGVLRKKGYHGPVKILNSVAEVVELILLWVRNNNNIFIGGNGQDRIMEIKATIEQITPLRYD